MDDRLCILPQRLQVDVGKRAADQEENNRAGEAEGDDGVETETTAGQVLRSGLSQTR